jgi:hypothetical protein
MVTVGRRRHALAAALTRDHCGVVVVVRSNTARRRHRSKMKRKKEAQNEDETSLSPPPPSSAVTRAKRAGVTLSYLNVSYLNEGRMDAVGLSRSA